MRFSMVITEDDLASNNTDKDPPMLQGHDTTASREIQGASIPTKNEALIE